MVYPGRNGSEHQERAGRTRLKSLLDLGEIPFYVGPCDSPSLPGLPNTLPFEIGVEDARIVQVPNPEVSRALAAAYAQGSMIGTPLAETGMGRRYADDFWSFLESYDFAGKRLLELGCGSGYLLHRLSQAGARCTGLEPGVQAQQASSHYGLEVIGDFFPSPHVEGPFDYVVHYCVLEHLEDPQAFLKAQVELLAPKGQILLAVPNVQPHLDAGDLSIFVHEHWSYFTPASLRQLLATVGLQTRRQVLSSYGGLVYLEASRGLEVVTANLEIAQLLSGWRRYFERGRAVLGDGCGVGVFPAVRLMNLISMLQLEACPRLFDDDPRLHGKFLPPLARAIEGRQDLLQNPVERLVLSSQAFGQQLREQLSQESALARTQLANL